MINAEIKTYSDDDIEELKRLEPAGCWVISSSFRVEVKAKPNWFHRQMSRIFFGWGWEDKE